MRCRSVLMTIYFMTIVWVIWSCIVVSDDHKIVEDYSVNTNNTRTVITLEEDKYAEYSFCPNKDVNNYKGWRGHFINSEDDTTEKNYIITDVKDVPTDLAPTIPTSFFIEESDFCTRRPYLTSIVYVHTAIMNTERRSIIRATWGRASGKVGVIFVVGIAKNNEEESIIASESPIHRDIVQGNYTDLYHFLVYKNLNALYWVMKNCKQIKWVVHSDDDVIFDVTKFLSFTNSDITGNYSRKIFCNLLCTGIVVRDRNSKWSLSEAQYPYKYFPLYCLGFLWFASIETTRQLLANVPLVKYTWVDDAYLTGLLAERAEIQRYHINISLSFQPNDIGKRYGWLHNGEKTLDKWNTVVSYYQFINSTDSFSK